MLRKVDRVVHRVAGLPAAVAYYRDVLGLALLRHDARLAIFRLADCDGELMLHTDPDLPSEAVYYLVDDVRDLHKRRAALRLTFLAPPQPVARGFRATVRDPFGTVLLLLDRTTESGTAAATPEDARVAGTLFGTDDGKVQVKRDALIRLYEELGRTADDLPYTPHFETLYKDYAAAHGERPPTRQETWRHLLNLRKAGKLPKLGEARSKPPEITPAEKRKLRDALGTDIGKRDRLPYTPRFDQLVDAFNKGQARPLSPHLVWRLVAALAK